MGHGKLRKFAENETFACLVQPAAEEVLSGRGREFALKDHPLKGHWNEKMFDAPRPIVLELGCGRGEYTIDLARRNPDYNYIGVDIKGARLWRGAKEATLCKMGNVAFLRTRIEFIPAFFAPSEVAEIWLTFSDPQLHHENSRLSSPMFLERYRQFLAPGGLIHLKTDSMFLHQYTLHLCRENSFPILACSEDLYSEDMAEPHRRSSPLRGSPPFSGANAGLCGQPYPPQAEATGGHAGRSLPAASRPSGPSRHSDPFRHSRPDRESPAAQRRAALGGAKALSDAQVDAIFEVHTYYETMFSRQGYRITYLCFRPWPEQPGGCDSSRHSRPDRESPSAILSPASFDADYWRSIEGPRHSVALPDI